MVKTITVKIKSIYVNGRKFSTGSRTLRSAKVAFQLENDQWIKYKCRIDDAKDDDSFCEEAIRRAEKYVVQTYVAVIDWRLDRKMWESDWTDVESEAGLNWKPVPANVKRDTIFPVREISFDEEVIIDWSKVKIDS